MFIPLGDAPNDSSHQPGVNYALIAANVLVYLWATFTYESAAAYQGWVQQWGFVPVAPQLETWFTHMFMHGGFLHLAGNMLFLWVFGDNVERRLGHVGYLLAYLSFGLAAVLLFLVLDPMSATPLVGASGAIFGVQGFYFIAFPRNRVRVFVWVILIFWLWVPARLVLGFYFVFNLIWMLTPQGEMSGGTIAYAAHVGGFVFGVGLALAFLLTRPRAERVGPAPLRASGDSPRLEAARRALRDGRYPEARAALEATLRDDLHSPDAPEAALLLGQLLARVEGRPEAARKVLGFAARLHPDPERRRDAKAELARLQGF